MKLEYDKALSNFSFKVNLRRYTKEMALSSRADAVFDMVHIGGAGNMGRGLHSFTLELNLSNSRTHS